MQTETLNGTQLLGNGLETITNTDKFREAMNKVCETAFAVVFHTQDEGKLKWRRTGEDMNDFITELPVKNGRGEEIIIPVFLLTIITNEGFKHGFLMLGSTNNAPCRNTMDPRVQRLYTQVTEKPWSQEL